MEKINRILQLNKLLNENNKSLISQDRSEDKKYMNKELFIYENLDVDEGFGSKIKNIRRKISDKREVKSLLSTHKQGLKNVKWAQDSGYMDPKINPGKFTYQKAKKSSELRDVYNHMHGKKRFHVKKVVGNN